MTTCVASVLEATYIGYMFYFHETSVDFNIIASPKHWFLHHLTGSETGLRICPLGRVLAVPAILLFVARCGTTVVEPWIRQGVYASMVLSLMNLNAVVYLIPVWMVELVLLPSLCKINVP